MVMLLIYKNKASGKHFIFIDCGEKDSGLFINPEGKFIELEYNLFFQDSTELENDDKEILNLVNAKQLNRYQNYRRNDIKRRMTNLFKVIENSTKQQREEAKKETPNMASIIEIIEKAIEDGISSTDFENMESKDFFIGRGPEI
jgi:hypothetical protein